MIWTVETYKKGVSPDVIKEYERYIKQGLIKVYNPIDEYKSEEDQDPVWETVELREEDLLIRIAKAKKREKESFQLRKKSMLIEF